MAANSLSGRVHGGSRYGGQVIGAAGRSGGVSKAIGNIVQRSASGGRSPFVYGSGQSTVGYEQSSGTSPSRYPKRMPSGYVVTRAEAQGQAGK